MFTDILRIVDRKLYYLTNFSKQRLSILFFKHLLDYYHQRELSSLIHIRPNFCLTFSRRISISIYFQDHFQISFYVSTSISDLDRRHWLISVLVGVRGLHRTAWVITTEIVDCNKPSDRVFFKNNSRISVNILH